MSAKTLDRVERLCEAGVSITRRRGHPVNSVHVRIGKRIRALRLAAGLTQKDLADRIGRTHSNVCHLEAGVHRIGAEALYRLAAVFGVTMDSFFEE